jgi:hypothetical protein
MITSAQPGGGPRSVEPDRRRVGPRRASGTGTPRAIPSSKPRENELAGGKWQ